MPRRTQLQQFLWSYLANKVIFSIVGFLVTGKYWGKFLFCNKHFFATNTFLQQTKNLCQWILWCYQVIQIYYIFIHSLLKWPINCICCTTEKPAFTVAQRSWPFFSNSQAQCFSARRPLLHQRLVVLVIDTLVLSLIQLQPDPIMDLSVKGWQDAACYARKIINLHNEKTVSRPWWISV